jgi:hypothetical protein
LAPRRFPRRGAFAPLCCDDELWHVKCISEVRSSTFLPGARPRSVFFPSLGGAFLFLLRSRRRAIVRRMPKDAFTLSDVREPTLTVVCEPCGRRGRYNVEKLMAKHGDAKILYLLDTLTSCPKTQSANIYDRCKARYEGLSLLASVIRCRQSPAALGRPACPHEGRRKLCVATRLSAVQVT